LPFPAVLPPLPLQLPLEVSLLKSSQAVWGSAVSSPSGVWGRAPAEIEFGAFYL